MDILDATRVIMNQLQHGEFVEGMQRFYANDVVNEEPTGITARTLGELVAYEREFQQSVESFEGVEVQAVGGWSPTPGEGVTFAEYSMHIRLKGGKSLRPKQVQVLRWRHGKVYHACFYYDPAAASA